MPIELLEDGIALVYELDEGVRADPLKGDGELTELVLLLYLLRESNRVAGSAIDIAYGSRINTRPIALAIGPCLIIQRSSCSTSITIQLLILH